MICMTGFLLPTAIWSLPSFGKKTGFPRSWDVKKSSFKAGIPKSGKTKQEGFLNHPKNRTQQLTNLSFT